MTVVPGHHGGPREPPWTLPTNQGPPQRRRCCFDAGVDLSPQQVLGRGPEAGLPGAGTASRGRHTRPGRSRSRCTKQATRSPQGRVRGAFQGTPSHPLSRGAHVGRLGCAVRSLFGLPVSRAPRERHGHREPGLPDSNNGSLLVVVCSLGHSSAPARSVLSGPSREGSPTSRPLRQGPPAAIQCTPTLPCVTFRLTLSKGT